MTICIDASLVIPLVTAHPLQTKAEALHRRWIASGADLIAPTLLTYEVCNGIYRYYAAGRMTADESAAALACVFSLGIILLEPPGLWEQALELAMACGLPATYDAHYLALAQREQATFYTADRRLAASAGDRFAWLQVVHLGDD